MGRMSSEISKKFCSATSLQASEGADEVVNCQLIELDSLPVSVKHEILEIGGHIELLKTCRFLSKSWNEICCRILRKVSAVQLNETEEDGADLDSFKDLVLDRHANIRSDWTSPFQNFSFLQAPCSNPSFARFAERQNMNITTLDIVHTEKFNPGAFARILELHQDSIIHLKIRGRTESSPFLTLGEKLGKGWRSLKSLTLVDTCPVTSDPCPHMDFIIELTGRTSIQKLTLDCHFQNTTRIFAGTKSRWGKLKCLELKSDKPPLTDDDEELKVLMKWTTEFKFPAFTSLVLWFRQDRKPDQTSKEFTPYLLPLIQRSSAVLQDLRISFMSISAVPSCPRLRNLSCTLVDGDRIQDFTDSRFPSLTSVHAILYWKEVPLYTDPKETARSGSKLASFKVNLPGAGAAQEAKETLWSSLRDYLPNLRTLDIQTPIHPRNFYVIRKRLPQLENLTIAYINSQDLLGTVCGPATIAKGWPCEDTESSALLEFTELTSLTLGVRVEVSREALIGCLGRLPRLKLLSFHWNSVLEALDVPKYLGHIPNLTIFNASLQQRRVLEKVARTMKSLQLKRFQS